jgi:chitin disaccharide deacetylase
VSAASPRRVILCADDFGLNQPASLAIIELMAKGAISAASCVVDGACCEPLARTLIEAAQGRSVGLHFNLTESPGAPRMKLGYWLLATYIARRVPGGSLEAEIDRQLGRFEDLFGRAPDFVDGHEHVHQLPIVRDALVRRMQRRYGCSVGIRSTVAREWRGVKAFVIERLGAPALVELARAAGFAHNSDFAGVYNLSVSSGYPDRMERWLRGIKDLGLVMCHPEAEGATAAPSPARFAEYQFLGSPVWPALRARLSIELTPFTPATVNREQPS